MSNLQEASSMAPLGLAAVGLLFGILLTILAVAVVALLYAAWQQRSEATAARTLINQVIARNTAAIDKLRGEVDLSLSRMDAERLYEASHAVQNGVRSLQQSTSTLSKLLHGVPQAGPGTVDQYGVPNSGLAGYASGGNNSLNYYPDAPGLDDEAIQDAATVEQWAANRSRVQYDAGSTPPASRPFEIYRKQQQDKADAASGRSSPIPVSSLPDLDDAHDLDAQQGEELSGIARHQVPGFTDGSDKSGIE